MKIFNGKEITGSFGFNFRSFFCNGIFFSSLPKIKFEERLFKYAVVWIIKIAKGIAKEIEGKSH